MTLGQLIDELKKLPGDMVFADGFGGPDSWRGVYSEIAFEPAKNVTVASMLEHAMSAVGATYQGYKGGLYTMSLGTDCHIADYGEYGGEEDNLSIWRWRLMLQNAAVPTSKTGEHQ